jgi:hypothetical protein
MRNRVYVAVLALLLGSAGALEAQIFTPSYAPPRPANEIGIYLNDGPGDFSVEGLWRRWVGTYDIGLRAGLASHDDVTILLGGQLRGPVRTTAPLAMAWTADVQGALGGRTGLGAGFGLTVGAAFPGAVTILPYIHPRVAVVSPLRRDGASDAGLEVLADFGLDLIMQPNLTLRVALGLGGPTSGLGVGFAWR